MSTVSEASENHRTESMDKDRRSATASDAPEAETGSNEAMHHSLILLYDSDSKNEPEEDNNTFLSLSSSS